MAVILICQTIVAFLSSQLLATVFGNVRQFFKSVIRRNLYYMLQKTYNVGSTVTHILGKEEKKGRLNFQIIKSRRNTIIEI